MTLKQVQAVQGARPFRPFTLHLADGDVLSVRHPEFLALSPAGRTVVVFGQDDEMSIVDLLLVTRIEMAKSSPSRRKRG